MARLEYIRYLWLLFTVSSVVSIPSSYLSSMTGGEGGVTWMGWAPQTGMTAFASSSNPWTSWDRGWKNTGVELEPPPKEKEPTQSEAHEDEFEPPKKWNKPKYDEDRPGASSKAEASLNAWFPIMLGLFPPQGDSNRNQQSGEPTWDNAKSITALANSVNHGSRGVASSHAVSYGGQPPNFRSKTLNTNLNPSNGKTPQDQYGSNGSGQSQSNLQRYYNQLKRYASA